MKKSEEYFEDEYSDYSDEFQNEPKLNNAFKENSITNQRLLSNLKTVKQEEMTKGNSNLLSDIHERK